jgi:hypothetical protein
MENYCWKDKHKLLAVRSFSLADVFIIFPWQIAHKGKLKDSQEIACLWNYFFA